MNWHLTTVGAQHSIGRTLDIIGHYPGTDREAESIVVSEADLLAVGWDPGADPDGELIRRAHQQLLMDALTDDEEEEDDVPKSRSGLTAREEALARLLADLFRSDLTAATWLIATIQPSVRDLAPSPQGMGPLPWARALVLSLDSATCEPTSRLWPALHEARPFRTTDIEAARVVP